MRFHDRPSRRLGALLALAAGALLALPTLAPAAAAPPAQEPPSPAAQKPPVAPPQEPPAAPAQEPPVTAFGEVLDVRVVNVEAVVTDRDGQRVTGLGREDFRLVVDGEEIPVEYFTEVRGGVTTAGEGNGVLPPGAAAGGAVGTSYLLYIDELTVRPPDRDRLLGSLRDQLVTFAPGDRMAVVAFDGTGLDMLSNWSGSARELEGALEKAAERPAWGLHWLAERHVEARTRELAGGGTFDVNRLGFEDLSYAERLVARIERAVSGAASAVRAFGRPPGRKVMVLVAGDWPFEIDRWVVGSNRFIHDPSIPDGARLYAPLVDAANLLGYTLYPADAGGLDPERLGDSGGGLRDPTATGTARERLVHDTFHYLAQETGGRAWLNARGAEALAETAADTRSYYWLGFTARRAGDQERHDIRVRVLRPGLEVRARDNFRDLSRREETSLAMESAVRFGEAPGALPLPAEVSRPRKAGLRRMEVRVKVGIPLDLVTFVPAPGGGVQGRVELRVAALDEYGETAEVPFVEVDLHLPARPPPGKYSIYEAPVKLRRARHRLLITVHDATSGEAAAQIMDVRP
jgi:VWFA-related protein